MRSTAAARPTSLAKRLLRLLGAAGFVVAASTIGAAGLPDPDFAQFDGGSMISGPAFAADGRFAFGTYFFDSFSGHNTPFLQLVTSTGLASEYGPDELPRELFAMAMSFDDRGRLVVAWYDAGRHAVEVDRYRSDGLPSTTFARTDVSGSLNGTSALVFDAEHRPVIGGSSGGGAIVARLKPNGGYDDSFGSRGVVVLRGPDGAGSAGVVSLATIASGAIVVVHVTTTRAWMQRLDPGGAIDRTFGVDGSGTVENATAAAIDRSGRVTVLAPRVGMAGSILRRFVDGRPDPAFGTGGTAEFGFAATALASDAQGDVYAGWLEPTPTSATYRVARIANDGTADDTYGIGGTASVTLPLEPESGSYPAERAYPPHLGIDHEGRAMLAATRTLRYFGPYTINSTQWIRFTGDTAARPPTATAIEYFHAAMGHYFTTADADEIAALDAGKFEGWARTGESFTVAIRGVGRALPTCRFFSGQTFAPKSSHFYTPYPGECDAADSSDEWSFEKIAYWLNLPDGFGYGNGTCEPPLRPLYRAFNRMQGEAPNHRYTTSAATLDALIAQGWQFEGEAKTRVFACVP